MKSILLSLFCISQLLLSCNIIRPDDGKPMNIKKTLPVFYRNVDYDEIITMYAAGKMENDSIFFLGEIGVSNTSKTIMNIVFTECNPIETFIKVDTTKWKPLYQNCPNNKLILKQIHPMKTVAFKDIGMRFLYIGNEKVITEFEFQLELIEVPNDTEISDYTLENLDYTIQHLKEPSLITKNKIIMRDRK